MTHEPGLGFWLLTRAVDIFSPGKGKHRINTRLETLSREREEERLRNSELQSENAQLRRDLWCVMGENNLFREQDVMNAVIHEPPFTLHNLPTGNSGGDTLQFAVPNGPLANAG